MQGIDDLREWSSRLTAAEKRYVSLLGKARAGAEGGTLVELWAWVQQSKPGDALPKPWQKQARTYFKRLRDLVLDALRTLDQQNSPQAAMLKHLEAAQLLFEKGLTKAARNQLAHADARATALCRNDIQLQVCAFLRKMEVVRQEADPFAALQAIHEKEAHALAQQANLRWLRNAFDMLLLSGSQAFSRQGAFAGIPFDDPDFLQRLHQAANEGDWLARSLAGDMLGILEIYQKEYGRAFERYAALVQEWTDAPDRQKEEMNLFLNICKNYQYACFLVNSSPEERVARLARMPSFQHLPPAFEIHHQYLIYRERISWVLSKAAFGMLDTLRPEIMAWLKSNGGNIGESRVLAIAFNLATAAFLNEDFSDALTLVALILSKGKKVARKDIRDFSLIYQAVMHYEVGNTDLNEYLIRAAKRKFSRHAHSDQFELAVLKCLTQCTNSKTEAERVATFAHLHQELHSLSNKLQSRLQVVGLSELMIWSEARRDGRTLKAVYMTALEAMDKAETAEAPS